MIKDLKYSKIKVSLKETWEVIVNKISQEDWNNIIQMMKEEYEISTAPFNSWIKPLTVHSVSDHTVNIMLSDGLSQMKGYISKKYLKQFVVTISEYYGDEYDVVIGTSDDFDKLMPNRTDKVQEVSGNTTIINKTLNPKYTFETFVVGKNNELAHATALAVATDPGDYGNPLFIYGGSGLGKTHLLKAIQHEVNAVFPDLKVVYIKTEEFANEFITALGNRTTDEFHEKYRTNIDVFLVDDIQFIAGKTQTEEEFFHTFNALVDNGKQVVLTSDRPPKEIHSLTDRLRSRFVSGLLADIQSPEFETRCAIIKRKARLLHF